MRTLRSLALAGLAVGSLSGAAALAEDPPIIRKDLLTAMITGDKNVARVEIKQIDFAPGQRTGVHRHPCPVVGYIAEGTIRFQVAGGPVETLKAGSAFFEPAHATVVQFDNASAQAPAKFVAFYLLGKDDKQLIEMMP